ncbi:P-loop NTPase fold protein [Streptacidiphilus sp. MAP5-52]|uniref:P-loop NTPase fold protein n=1 Tax=Streptacidiphilus sp. MAP5-52 TaxID=3156267 RepID=UPI0035160459
MAQQGQPASGNAAHAPWTTQRDADDYRTVVGRCLNEEEISSHFGRRTSLTLGAVRQAALEGSFVLEAFATTRAEYVSYGRARHAAGLAESTFTTARTALRVDWWMKGLAAALAAAVLWPPVNLFFAAGHWGYGYTLLFLAVAVALFVVILARSQGRPHNIHTVSDLAYAWIKREKAASRARAQRNAWTTELADVAVLPQLRVVVKQMLGSDSDTLNPDDGHEGLRDVQDPKYVVHSRAERLLRQKLLQLDGGTIAICGPRGAGKSTLLRTCSARADRSMDLSVFVHAPAEYTPQDFLLTLFGQVCEQYLAFFGDAPSDAGVFAAVTRQRRVLHLARKTAKWLLSFTVALALLILALSRPAVLFYRHTLKPRVLDHTDSWWRAASTFAVDFWHHHLVLSSIVLIVAAALVKPSLRRAPKGPPSLNQRCQRYLYRLRPVQNSSTAVNMGVSRLQGITFGRARTTSLSSVPFTFPQLVTDFRDLLADIARRHQMIFPGARVVIAIDELDRVGDTDQARRFLSQIKAIFGIENVYYLISVAEDVGAAFVRRGLPHRDVTDSSLDDVLYLPARTLEESRSLLTLRAPSITATFAELIHALSGGIPRDLIRYARRLIELHHWTEHFELKDLAPTMISEDLADTLDGFRTLLSAQEWTPSNGHLLNSLHDLVRLLHSPTEQNSSEARAKIRDLAADPSPSAPTGRRGASEPVLAGVAQTLWQEASACALFSLTLLEIYAEPDFDGRRTRARAIGRSGHAQRLAEARLEFAASPHSARIILEEIRAAWSLAPAHR